MKSRMERATPLYADYEEISQEETEQTERPDPLRLCCLSYLL